jgi:hypothetical protein
MARKSALQPLRRYDKPPEKTHRRNIPFVEPSLQKIYQHKLGSNMGPLDPQPDPLPMHQTYTCLFFSKLWDDVHTFCQILPLV